MQVADAGSEFCFFPEGLEGQSFGGDRRPKQIAPVAGSRVLLAHGLGGFRILHNVGQILDELQVLHVLLAVC